jgi:nucleoside-diphosphate-sugar epimerase
MDKPKVMISGGTGFCGNWMQATCPPEIGSAWFMNHDQYENREWDKFDWDYIIHLAPISPSRVLKYAQKHKTKVLFASSGAVYEGMGEYAYNKRLWEQECIYSGVNVVIARLFATSGLPFQKNKALSIFIQNAMQGKPIQVWGKGDTVRTYLYGFDVATWFWKILLEGEGTYDVGSVNPYTMLELAYVISKVLPTTIKFIEHKETPTPTFYVPPKHDAVFNLGCNETIFLPEAIERMIHDA